MFLLFRFLIFTLLFSFSHFSFSASYLWSGGGFTASSPSAVCNLIAESYTVSPQSPVKCSRLDRVDERKFIGYFQQTSNGSTYDLFGAHRTISRSGDSCSDPSATYNTETGECELPRDCSNVSPGIFKSPSGPVINSGGRNYVATGYPSSSACYNGCSYSISTTSASCYADPGGATGFCNYIGTGSGSECSAPDAALGSTGDPLNPPDTPDVPPSDPNDPGCPPGYGWSGTTCAKSPGDGGGDAGGGDSGGGDSGGGDSGGGDSGGGDSGGGNGGGDSGGGDTGGGDSGGGDTGGGSGDGSGNGSGDGSGNGDGDGDGEQPGTCDSGACGQLGQGDKGNFDDFNAEYDQLIEQTKSEISSYKSRFGSLASRTIETNLSSGSADLPCWSFSFFGKTFSICLSSFSGELQVLRYAILFIVAVICLFIIFGGSKEGN